jgi:hypothetical protein
MYNGFREENLKEGGNFEDLSADGRLLLKHLNYDGGGVQDLSGSGQGQVARCCEPGNEPAGYIKCRELRDYTRNWLCSKHCAPFSRPAKRARM